MELLSKNCDWLKTTYVHQNLVVWGTIMTVNDDFSLCDSSVLFFIFFIKFRRKAENERCTVLPNKYHMKIQTEIKALFEK